MKSMGGKIKKFFLNFKRFNKPAVLAAVFLFIFLGLALPLQFAQAWGWGNIFGGILGAIMSIPINFIAILLQVVLAISNLFVGLAGLILNWVISPYFMSLPYTHGGIVDVGWPLVRDFINMFFIIALVIIGLATALRIKEYQAQKTLPLLIIIAILINFTPVICGLIMDAQNILMNFFLEEISGFQTMLNFFGMQGSSLLEAISHFFDISYAAGFLGKTIAMIAFDWIAGFVFLMFALLFIMRYIMIWVLVIVSPIAFFSRIFPGSQRYLFKSILGWDEWWKQFIEWSMIGIIGAFFLYLAEQLVVHMPAQITAGIPPGGALGIITAPLVEFMNNLLPWGVVLAFLIIGFFIATSTSAMGAGAITSFFREKGVSMVKAAGRGMIVRPLTEEVFPRAERVLRLKEAAGRVAGRLRAVPGVRHLGPVAALEKYGEWREDINKAKEAAAPYSSYTIGERIRRGVVVGKRAAGELLEIVTRGDSEDYFRAMRDKYGVKTDEELMKHKGFQKETEDLLEIAYKGGLGNDIIRRDPRLAAVLAGKSGVGFNYEAEKTPETAIARAVGEARAQHIAQWEKEVVKDENVVKALMKSRGLDVFRQIDRQVKDGRPATIETMSKIWEDYVGGKAKWEGLSSAEKDRTEEEFRKAYPLYWDKDKGAVSNPRFISEGWPKDPRSLFEPPPEPAIPRGLGVLPPEFEEKEVPPTEWPKVEKGMPKDIKEIVKEGQEHIKALEEKEKSLEILNKSIEELKKDIASLKEKAIKTPAEEELIRRTEEELLPAREEEGRLTQESISEIRSRLEDLRERIKPWEEHKRAVEAGEKEEKRVKEIYKRLEKEAKEIKKKK